MKMKWASIRARRTAALAATAIAVTACAVLQPGTAQASTLQPGTAQASTYPTTSFPAYTQPVTITWWTFTANPESEIKAFNKVYPNIHIVDPLMGANTDEYTRLTTAIKGGSGGPDVAEVEYEYLPKFIATDGLLNIAKYVDQYKDLFPSWTWNQVSVGKAVYGVPQDVGPMTMTYQPAVLAKYGLAVPKTWAQFAAEGEVLHQKDPGEYMTYVPLNDAAWWMTMFWQAGAVLFKQNANGSWQVNLDSAVVRKVSSYWGQLIKEGVVDATQDWTPAWEHAMGQGTFATVPGATWTPNYMIQPFADAATAKAWRMTSVPQWSASSAAIGANEGGAANVVLAQSKHQEAAAIFAAWIDASEQGVATKIANVSAGGQGLTAAATYSDTLPAFSAPASALDGQDEGPVMKQASAIVDPSFQWSPWTDYVFNELEVEYTDAAGGGETWDEANANIQRSVLVFAESMGYDVAGPSSASGSSQAAASVSAWSSPALYIVIGLGVLIAAVVVYRRRTVPVVGR